MPSAHKNSLIWVNEDLAGCLMCSGQASAEVEKELTFAGTSRLSAMLYFDQCHTCGCYYGYLEDLEHVLDAAGWETSDVEDFYRGEQPFDAFIALGTPFGLMPWTAYRDLLLKAREETRKPKPPPPASEAVQALPVRTEAWELGVRVADWVSTDDDTPMLSFFAVVVNESAVIRQTDLVPELPPDAPRLAELILRATTQSDLDDPPCRPLEVLIDDAPMAQALRAHLAPAAIPVRAAPTPHSDEVLAVAVESIRRSTRPSYLIDFPDREVRAFMEAARAFFRLRPWDRLDDDHFVGFRFDGGPWRYLNVMGQRGEEFGLSLFDDWLQLCRFIHNQPSLLEAMLDDEAQVKPLQVAGALEGISLNELHVLNPDDAVHLHNAGVEPISLEGHDLTGYPIPQRFGPDGLEPPLRSLSFYRRLMHGLTTTLSSRKVFKIKSIKRSVTLGGRTLTLRYPARGLESVGESNKWFRLVISTGLPAVASEDGPEDARIVVDTPVVASLFDISDAIQQKAGGAFRMLALYSGRTCVWREKLGQEAPAPLLTHLQSLPELTVDCLEDSFPLRVTRLANPAGTALHVRFEEA